MAALHKGSAHRKTSPRRILLDYTTGGLAAVAKRARRPPVYQANGLLGPRLAGASVEERGPRVVARVGQRVLAEFLEYDRRMRFVGEYLTKVDGATSIMRSKHARRSSIRSSGNLLPRFHSI